MQREPPRDSPRASEHRVLRRRKKYKGLQTLVEGDGRKKRAATSPTAQGRDRGRTHALALAHQSREILSCSNGIGTNESRWISRDASSASQ